MQQKFSARSALTLARQGKWQGQPERMLTKGSLLGMPGPPPTNRDQAAVSFGANVAHASPATEYRKGHSILLAVRGLLHWAEDAKAFEAMHSTCY